jgi:hypothetical protein
VTNIFYFYSNEIKVFTELIYEFRSNIDFPIMSMDGFMCGWGIGGFIPFTKK